MKRVTRVILWLFIFLSPDFYLPSAWAQNSQKASSPPQASPNPPVISLKYFMSVPTWTLDITWSAKESYEDKDCSAQLEMTATTRCLLKQRDKRDDWGRWGVESLKSWNMTLTGFQVWKGKHDRLDYKSTGGQYLAAAAVFQVGGSTPGYELDCIVSLPIRMVGSEGVNMDSGVALGVHDILNPSPAGLCTGPLPAMGDGTIHGSRVVPLPIGPFQGNVLPYAKVGIQYVLQPLAPLAPLKPLKKKLY